MKRHDFEIRLIADNRYLGKITWEEAMTALKAYGFDEATSAKILLGIR